MTSPPQPLLTAPPNEIFDSLPYYDNELEIYPILKQKVEQELAREPKPPQTFYPRVPPEPILFAVCSISIYILCKGINDQMIVQNHPELQAELARVEAQQPL